MSSLHNANVSCPKCQTEYSISVWDSVNVSLDPSLKTKLLEGELFLGQCPACGEKSRLQYPCLYHDMEQKLMIWHIPPNEDAETFLKQETPEIAEGYTFRVVRGENDLREKVIISDEGFDDRALELIKLFVLHSASEQNPDLNVVAAYFTADGRGGHKYVIFTDDGDTYSSPLDKGFYQGIADRVAQVDVEQGFRIIDYRWASEHLKANG